MQHPVPRPAIHLSASLNLPHPSSLIEQERDAELYHLLNMDTSYDPHYDPIRCLQYQGKSTHAQLEHHTNRAWREFHGFGPGFFFDRMSP